MSRLPEISPDSMEPLQRAVFDRIASGPRGRVRGPLAAWLHSPKFAECVHPTGEFLRYGSAVSGRITELAILVVARHWNAAYEWYVHAPLAEKAGVSASVVAAISMARRPAFDTPNDEVVWEIVTELLERKSVSDSTYSRAVELLGHQRLVELCGVVGYYSLGAFTLNLFRIDPPVDGGPTLPPLTSGA